MTSLETAIRLFVIGQEFLIAAYFLFGKGARAVRVSGALLVLSIAGHLYMSDNVLRDSMPLIVPIAVLLALSVPYCLWLFARALFGAAWPAPILTYTIALVGIVVWVIYLAGDALHPAWGNVANITMHVVALGVIVHALWLTVRDRPDDLVEKRRTFRLFFVVVVSVQTAAVLVAELLLGSAAPPVWLELAHIAIIECLTVGLTIPLLRLDSGFFEVVASVDRVVAPGDANGLGVAEGIVKQKLTVLMDAGYYRETGLTIGMLAERLSYPEHQLRRLINRQLGYRNFSDFLNRYRISEAKRRLVDPERARTPVLTIALDLGYASIGPFNRAFKAATGLTPTEFRQKYLGQQPADSE